MLNRSLHNSNCVSSSHADPWAIPKNCKYSFLFLRPYPSDTLEGTLTADLRICDDNANCSSFGNSLHILYTSLLRSMDFCQTIKSLKLLVLLFIFLFPLYAKRSTLSLVAKNYTLYPLRYPLSTCGRKAQSRYIGVGITVGLHVYLEDNEVTCTGATKATAS